jgi:diadenylate cyclase
MRASLDWLWQSPLGTVGLVDWVDITVLAAAIYLVLRVLRGTRAAQSLVGLLLLGAVYLASGLLGLSTVHWVLDNVVVYAVLGLIILFQEDIRRVLAEAGGRVFTGSGQRSTADAGLVEEIVKAVFLLASRKIGALVAVERRASLHTFSESALPVDAVVTREVLQALFHPSSPVHDGAVVIGGGRISKAGVFLPISLSKGLPKVYGTRHRAAIGLTERTDAVGVLVSEERGTVAVVVDGRVEPMVDENDLRQRLQELLGQRRQPVQKEVASA